MFHVLQDLAKLKRLVNVSKGIWGHLVIKKDLQALFVIKGFAVYMLCCISRDTSVKVWSLHTFEMLHHMGGHTSVVTCVRLLPLQSGHNSKNGML